MKRFFKWVGIIFLALLAISIMKHLFGGKDVSAASTGITTDTTKEISVDTSKAVVTTQSNWNYTIDSSDKMDNSIVKIATCDATNKIQLSAPYDGGSTATINLRTGYKHKSNEAYITIDKGQFIGSMDDEASIKVKFDDGKPESFNYSEASDGSSNIIFLSNSSSFVEKIKKAKHVIIEAEFFENGMQQMEFNTDGLVWK